MKKRVYRNPKVVLWLSALCGAFLLFGARHLLPALLGVMILYTLMRPLLIYFHHKRKWNRFAAGLMVLLFSVFVITIPAYLLLQMVVGKVREISQEPHVFEALNHQIISQLQLKLVDSKLWLDLANDFKSTLFTWLSTVLSVSVNLLFQLAVIYFVLFYLFTNFKAFEERIFHYSPFRRKHSRLFALEFKIACYGNVLGQGLVALAQGSLLLLAYGLLDIPDPFFWGGLSIFAAFIPYIGTALIYAPLSLYLWSAGELNGAIILVLYGLLIVGSADTLLRIFISRKFYNVHPLVSFLGISIGLPLFGLLGLVFGPFLISMFLLFLKVTEEIYGERRRDGRSRSED